MRFRYLLAGLVVALGSARADRAEELARIHIEAIGGRERIEKLEALRATGTVQAAGRKVRFTMIAARPDRIRLETEAGGRTLVQGSDGEQPPWEFDTGTWPPKYRAMPEGAAKTFVADSEFDDPLVAGEKRGFVLDYAGEVEVGGRKLLRVLVTRKLTETYALLLDAQTYFIVKRIEQRQTAGGRTAQVVTHYEDFRPVEGVLLPHQITVAIDGRTTQQTQIARIDANPKVTEETFGRPSATGSAPAKAGD
jgi:hypothetical protein